MRKTKIILLILFALVVLSSLVFSEEIMINDTLTSGSINSTLWSTSLVTADANGFNCDQTAIDNRFCALTKINMSFYPNVTYTMTYESYRLTAGRTDANQPTVYTVLFANHNDATRTRYQAGNNHYEASAEGGTTTTGTIVKVTNGAGVVLINGTTQLSGYDVWCQHRLTYLNENITYNYTCGGSSVIRSAVNGSYTSGSFGFGMSYLDIVRFRNFLLKNSSSPTAPINNISFFAQTPSDITSTSLFNQNVVVQYNISNTTLMNNSFINLSLIGSKSCLVFQNGSCLVSNNTPQRIYSTSNTSQIFNYTLGENNIYPSTYYLDTPYFARAHSVQNIGTGNDIYKIKLINISNSTQYNFFEVMANSTASAEVFYCNNSYTTGSPSISSFCAQIYSGVINFNHTHSAFVSHALFPFSINNSRVGSVLVTSDSYFLIRGGNTNIYYVSNATGRTNTFEISGNNGGSYTDNSATQTADSHAHQFSGTDYISYLGCRNMSGSYECTTARNDTLDLTPVNPLGVQILSPNQSTYTQFINITYTIFTHPNAPNVNNSAVRIDLLNNDSTFNQTIRFNALNTSYYWDTYAYNLSANQNYYLNITINDTTNKRTSTISSPFNFSANSNLKVEVYNLTQKIQNFSINVTDLTTLFTTLYQTNSSETNGTINISTIKGRTYYIELNPPADFAIMNTTQLVSNTYENYTFGALLTNSVNITIRDEATGSLLNTQNVTVLFQLANTTTEYTYNTSTAFLFAYNLLPGSYAVVFSTPNYAVRTYQITIANRSTQSLNAYMVASTSFTVFSFADINSLNPLQDVSVTMSKIINSSWVTVESKFTDPTGRIGFYFTPNTKYQFYATKSGYDSKLFILDPILFTSYNIKMTPNANNTPGFSDVTAYFSPGSIPKNVNTNFSFGIQSPEGILVSYGYNLSWDCGNLTFSGVNAIGDTNVANFTVTCGNYGDYVRLLYFYTTSSGSYTQKTFNLPIDTYQPQSNYTFSANTDKTYGLGEFERISITTIFAMLIGGIAGMIGGALVGLALALFIFGYFVFIGFISGWYLVLPAFVGVIYIFGRKD